MTAQQAEQKARDIFAQTTARREEQIIDISDKWAVSVSLDPQGEAWAQLLKKRSKTEYEQFLHL